MGRAYFILAGTLYSCHPATLLQIQRYTQAHGFAPNIHQYPDVRAVRRAPKGVTPVTIS